MGLFIKNVLFMGAACWLLLIWGVGERMDDLFFAVPLFFVTGFWLSRHGRKKEKLKVNLEEPEVSTIKQKESPAGLRFLNERKTERLEADVEEHQNSNTEQNGSLAGLYLLILFIVGAVIMANYDTETPEERSEKHASCLRSLDYVQGENLSEGQNYWSKGEWQMLYRECMSLPN